MEIDCAVGATLIEAHAATPRKGNLRLFAKSHSEHHNHFEGLTELCAPGWIFPMKKLGKLIPALSALQEKWLPANCCHTNVNDLSLNLLLFVDLGAQVGVMPRDPGNETVSQLESLSTATDSDIPKYGYRSILSILVLNPALDLNIRHRWHPAVCNYHIFSSAFGPASQCLTQENNGQSKITSSDGLLNIC